MTSRHRHCSRPAHLPWPWRFSMSSVIGIVLLCRLLLSNQAVLAANADDRNQRTETAEEDDDHSNRRDQQRTVGGPIIGIDLGTTYSCAGVFRPGKAGVEIIPNDQGNRITPSYVAFVPPPPDGQQQQRQQRERRLVGDSAKNQAALNPENTIFDVKRLIGRRFSDPSVLRDRELVPYRIVAGGGGGGDGDDATDDDDDDRAHVLANGRAYAPEEISGMVLSKLRADAERYLGVPIDRAVVTVPAYFNDAQRHATRDAGVIAGLRVERVINEPTAAAMAYGLERRREDDDTGGGERIVLVFDLGGGTFDVTLLAIDDGVFEVLATNGDTHLGGSDVDRIVMEHFLETMARRDGRDDVAGDRRALQKLRREAERVKRALSSQLSARLELEDLLPGYDFSATLTRAKFEELNDALFRRTLGPVRKAMEDAALEVGEVDEIVLVGGSTRIPRVRKLVEDFFDGKGIEAGIDPDESVAAGAAIQGSVLSGEGGHDDARDLMLLDVAPLSLGTEVDGGLMRVLVKRGTTIPTETTMDFHTVHDRQTHMTIDVFEGERSRTEHNHLLGLFEMTDLPPAPRGEVEVRITFKVDANGMLEVTAANLATKSTKSITITAEDGRLSEEKIEAMVKEAERFAEEDAREAERIEARNQLESHLYRVSSSLNENEERIEDKDDLMTLMDSLDEMAEWLDGNQDAAETEFRQRYAEIDSLSKPVLQSLYEAGGEDRDGFDDEL